MESKLSSDTIPAKDPVWNMGPGRTAALKLLNEQTGKSVMAFEEISPAGSATPMHLHRNSDEVMYILSGDYSFKVGDTVTTGGPGTCVFMPRGIPHAWKCNGSESGRAFFIYTPGEAGGVFEESIRLQRPAPASTDVDPRVAELFRRYGWEIVGPPPF